ncbi:hypothetical protein LOK49_LG02G01077 [Camellia lanceoleosa]|uniref:Uncharacterized protein n=1 Tax=Camellia lanceoleosa TaxID=1840588 RepID=A0ACC0IR13_9ERIC|nr:hypothetical protein LOK49_LG02G01077 [Camellia lanceoleosa]
MFLVNFINDYDYAFAEYGLVAYKDGKLIGSQSLRSYLGEEKLKGFINFTLHYIADLDIPIKRGNIALGKLVFRMFIDSQFHGGQRISSLQRLELLLFEQQLPKNWKKDTDVGPRELKQMSKEVTGEYVEPNMWYPVYSPLLFMRNEVPIICVCAVQDAGVLIFFSRHYPNVLQPFKYS